MVCLVTVSDHDWGILHQCLHYEAVQLMRAAFIVVSLLIIFFLFASEIHEMPLAPNLDLENYYQVLNQLRLTK